MLLIIKYRINIILSFECAINSIFRNHNEYYNENLLNLIRVYIYMFMFHTRYFIHDKYLVNNWGKIIIIIIDIIALSTLVRFIIIIAAIYGGGGTQLMIGHITCSPKRCLAPPPPPPPPQTDSNLIICFATDFNGQFKLNASYNFTYWE